MWLLRIKNNLRYIINHLDSVWSREVTKLNEFNRIEKESHFFLCSIKI